jgi:hypothetical protein
LAAFPARHDARRSFAYTVSRGGPKLEDTVECWHALLLPIEHRGECNHLDRSSPRLVFESRTEDPGGPLFVMTTAGYVMGPDLDFARVIDFRVHVDKVH